MYVNIDLDVWRFVTCNKGTVSEQRRHYLFEKYDLARLKYPPEDWWYNLNQDGEGAVVDFPLKAKPLLSWSAQKYIKMHGKIIKAVRFPMENVCQTIIRKACHIDSIS